MRRERAASIQLVREVVTPRCRPNDRPARRRERRGLVPSDPRPNACRRGRAALTRSDKSLCFQIDRPGGLSGGRRTRRPHREFGSLSPPTFRRPTEGRRARAAPTPETSLLFANRYGERAVGRTGRLRARDPPPPKNRSTSFFSAVGAGMGARRASAGDKSRCCKQLRRGGYGPINGVRNGCFSARAPSVSSFF